ncbi:peptide MFS transporter [Algivirga pacifica]|uniref:Peptide MFS transporter n=1 Tax=Algivirga pacifica TaxID=1162670 RepID=A0ABP9DEW3_9BACT
MNNTTVNSGHPKGLYILFFTEMWERFSYYGMRALLVLFLTAPLFGMEGIESPAFAGLGWDRGDALSLYGTYTMLVYLMSIPGGILADKWLGQKKTVMLGGWLLVAGHGVMAIPQTWAFYTALALIVLGVGCLKPNISTMVGGLYKDKDPRRDKGFTIFYIGINLGAFLAPLACGSIAATYGWHWGFGLAGIGMAFGQIVYMWGQKYLQGVGESLNTDQNLKAANDKPLTNIEKDRVVVLLISFLIIILFWAAFEQAGGLMNLYAQEKTNRVIGFLGDINLSFLENGNAIPAAWFQSVNSLFILTLGLPVAAFWAARSKAGKESSTLLKMAIGTMIMGAGFLFMSKAAIEAEATTDAKAAMIWLVLAYLFHTVGELCASPTALSFITKLAPAKYASIMMGVYFAATGLGNKVAGVIGEVAVSDSTSELTVFTSIAVIWVALGGLVLLFLKKLKKLTHGAEDGEYTSVNEAAKGEVKEEAM